MSRPRNPNPPIRTHLVKQQKYGGIWYVMERKVQYSNEKKQTICLDSKALGVLLNKDDDVKDMIPIDEWNAQQKQKKEEERKAKTQAKKDTNKAVKVRHTTPGIQKDMQGDDSPKADVYEKAMEEGRMEAREEIAVTMLKNSFSWKQIQLCTSLSPARIEELAKENYLCSQPLNDGFLGMYCWPGMQNSLVAYKRAPVRENRCP